MKNKSQKLTIS